MDIGAAGIVGWIASSTNSSFSTYSPIFTMIGGIVLAMVVITFLIGMLSRGGTGNGVDGMDLDDTMEI